MGTSAVRVEIDPLGPSVDNCMANRIDLGLVREGTTRITASYEDHVALHTLERSGDRFTVTHDGEENAVAGDQPCVRVIVYRPGLNEASAKGGSICTPMEELPTIE